MQKIYYDLHSGKGIALVIFTHKLTFGYKGFKFSEKKLIQ